MVLKELQRGVDGARARGVGAAELLLEGLDDLVAVPRLFLEEAQHDEAEGALLEHPSAAPAAPGAAFGEECVHESGVASPLHAVPVRAAVMAFPTRAHTGH